MGTNETNIQNAVRLHAAKRGITLFRNNIGVAYYTNGQPVTYGLTTGSADLIGWRTITVTPDMVGQQIAQFVSIEVKTHQGRVSTAQQNWLERVRAAGGVAIIARDKEDVDGIS